MTEEGLAARMEAKESWHKMRWINKSEYIWLLNFYKQLKVDIHNMTGFPIHEMK